MEIRGPEVIVDPSEAQLADVAAMTGVNVSSSAQAVAVEGSSSGGYRLRVLPASAPAVAEIVSEESPEPTPTELVVHEVSPAEAIAELSAPALAADDDGSLIGPEGSFSGERVVDISFADANATLAADFKPEFVQGPAQRFRASCENTFYVYWVDGSTPPHYVVVLRQRVLFGGGRMKHNRDNIRGFGMFSARTTVRDVRASTGEVDLVDTSPAAGDSWAHVRVDARMTHRALGGDVIDRVTMQERFPLALDGWTAHNRFLSPDLDWEFAQDHTIDGDLNGDRLVNIHFHGQDVRPFPAITASSLVARTYAVWRVGGGRDAKLSCAFQLLPSFMVLANGSARTVNRRGGVTRYRAHVAVKCDLDLRQISDQRRAPSAATPSASEG